MEAGAHAANHAGFIQHRQNRFGIDRCAEGELVEEARRQDLDPLHRAERVGKFAGRFVVQFRQLLLALPRPALLQP